MRTYLDFEKPIAELESKVADLKTLASGFLDLIRAQSTVQAAPPAPLAAASATPSPAPASPVLSPS